MQKPSGTHPAEPDSSSSHASDEEEDVDLLVQTPSRKRNSSPSALASNNRPFKIPRNNDVNTPHDRLLTGNVSDHSNSEALLAMGPSAATSRLNGDPTLMVSQHEPKPIRPNQPPLPSLTKTLTNSRVALLSAPVDSSSSGSSRTPFHRSIPEQSQQAKESTRPFDKSTVDNQSSGSRDVSFFISSSSLRLPAPSNAMSRETVLPQTSSVLTTQPPRLPAIPRDKFVPRRDSISSASSPSNDEGRPSSSHMTKHGKARHHDSGSDSSSTNIVAARKRKRKLTNTTPATLKSSTHVPIFAGGPGKSAASAADEIIVVSSDEETHVKPVSQPDSPLASSSRPTEVIDLTDDAPLSVVPRTNSLPRRKLLAMKSARHIRRPVPISTQRQTLELPNVHSPIVPRNNAESPLPRRMIMPKQSPRYIRRPISAHTQRRTIESPDIPRNNVEGPPVRRRITAMKSTRSIRRPVPAFAHRRTPEPELPDDVPPPVALQRNSPPKRKIIPIKRAHAITKRWGPERPEDVIVIDSDSDDARRQGSKSTEPVSVASTRDNAGATAHTSAQDDNLTVVTVGPDSFSATNGGPARGPQDQVGPNPVDQSIRGDVVLPDLRRDETPQLHSNEYTSNTNNIVPELPRDDLIEVVPESNPTRVHPTHQSPPPPSSSINPGNHSISETSPANIVNSVSQVEVDLEVSLSSDSVSSSNAETTATPLKIRRPTGPKVVGSIFGHSLYKRAFDALQKHSTSSSSVGRIEISPRSKEPLSDDVQLPAEIVGILSHPLGVDGDFNKTMDPRVAEDDQELEHISPNEHVTRVDATPFSYSSPPHNQSPHTSPPASSSVSPRRSSPPGKSPITSTFSTTHSPSSEWAVELHQPFKKGSLVQVIGEAKEARLRLEEAEQRSVELFAESNITESEHTKSLPPALPQADLRASIANLQFTKSLPPALPKADTRALIANLQFTKILPPALPKADWGASRDNYLEPSQQTTPIANTILPFDNLLPAGSTADFGSSSGNSLVHNATLVLGAATDTTSSAQATVASFIDRGIQGTHQHQTSLEKGPNLQPLRSILRKLKTGRESSRSPRETSHPLSATCRPQTPIPAGALDQNSASSDSHVPGHSPTTMQIPSEEISRSLSFVVRNGPSDLLDKGMARTEATFDQSVNVRGTSESDKLLSELPIVDGDHNFTTVKDDKLENSPADELDVAMLLYPDRYDTETTDASHRSSVSNHTPESSPPVRARRRSSRYLSRSSGVSSADPMDLLDEDGVVLSSVTQESSTPKTEDEVQIMGGLQVTSWRRIRKPGAYKPPYFQTKDLPYELADYMNFIGPSYRASDMARIVFEASISENTAIDEPKAPDIQIINNVDDEATPPWEFYYSNHMWHDTGVPPPDVDNLVGCDCIGRCNPKSKTCSCLKKQSDAGYFNGFLYDDRGRLKEEGYPIYECNAFCGCSDDCPNRVVQHGRKYVVNIEKTEHKGWGVFAGNKKIPRGSFIGIYAGELLADAVGEQRGVVYNKFGRTYLFDLDFHFLKDQNTDWSPRYVVDAYHAGNFTRFLNHSCEPNCHINACYINEANRDKPLLTLFALHDIYPHEELCFSYTGNDDTDDEDDPGPVGSQKDAVYVPCRCGASSCKGYMWKD